MSKGFIGLLAALCTVALVIAGCGGGGGGGNESNTEVTASSLSKAEFVKKADAICKKEHEQISNDFVAFAKEKANVTKPTEADYLELLNKVIKPNLEAEVSEIRTLGAPKGDEAKIEALLSAVEASLAKLEAEPEVVVGDTGQIFAKPKQLATAYGFKVCGGG